MNALKQTYANESDSYLARKAKDGNTLEKGTALVALKERGYDTETIKRMID